MSNIIDIISNAGLGKKNMSAADYYTENNPNGYDTKLSLKSFLESIGDNNLSKLDLGFEYLSQGYNNDNPPVIYPDRQTGLKCIYAQFNLAASSQPLKLMVNDGLVKLIKDCQQGKVKISFTLTDLYNEAIKAAN